MKKRKGAVHGVMINVNVVIQLFPLSEIKQRESNTLVECFQFTIHHAHECAACHCGCTARAMTDDDLETWTRLSTSITNANMPSLCYQPDSSLACKNGFQLHWLDAIAALSRTAPPLPHTCRLRLRCPSSRACQPHSPPLCSLAMPSRSGKHSA